MTRGARGLAPRLGALLWAVQHPFKLQVVVVAAAGGQTEAVLLALAEPIQLVLRDELGLGKVTLGVEVPEYTYLGVVPREGPHRQHRAWLQVFAADAIRGELQLLEKVQV